MKTEVRHMLRSVQYGSKSVDEPLLRLRISPYEDWCRSSCRCDQQHGGQKMKTLYIDCGMGAAGDMLTAALLELLPDPDKYIAKLNAIGIPDVRFIREHAEKCGITGTHVSVSVDGVEEGEEMHHHEHEHHHDHDHEHEHHLEHHHDHTHSSLSGIEHIVRDHLDLLQIVRDDILSVYQLIAEAESHVHGVPVTDIHFHEVGTMDAVADITAVCLLMNEIRPDEVAASPVHVGSGQVRCAHGILPVPAPATAYILRDVPIYGGEIKGELCTPTGAALLKHFVTRFGNMPVMKTSAVGYGMGKKDFPKANCVRVMLGETEDKSDRVARLSCNVDDMTAESIGYAAEKLFENGALEVYTIPIGMKKCRPGTLINVLCREKDKEQIIRQIFKYTSTIGIRESAEDRYVLDRRIEEVETPYGKVRRKISSGYGVKRVKYEYDDLSRIADSQGISLEAVRKLIVGQN